jgi:hypothetical protein
MTKVIPFRPKRTDADVSSLATSIFTHLATHPDVEPRRFIGMFRSKYPELTLPDLLAGFVFARKVLNVFERLAVELDADDDEAGA